MKKENFWNLQNIITLSRILFAILFVVSISNKILSILFLLIIVLSDYLDGLAARKKREESEIGAFLDPLVDKISVFIIALSLFFYYRIEFWKFYLLIFRDLFVFFFFLGLIGKKYKSKYSKLSKARMFGKVATVFQFITIFFVLIQSRFQVILFFITFLFGVLASVDYIKKYEELRR